MSKPISSYPEWQRDAVIARRITGGTGGLGYLSAQDAFAIKARKEATRARREGK